MTIELAGIIVKHERRIRLVFSAALDSSAFGTPAPAAYVVDNEDGAARSPGVSAALLVVGANTNVELALDTDLATGALYRVRAVGIVAADASTSTSASDQHFRFGIPTSSFNVEPKVSDGELLLYGRDLVWSGIDYLETVEGDLATTEGAENAINALDRRLRGHPLPWAPKYSPRAREFVDAPLPSIGGLRGRIEAQAQRDDRFKGIVAKLVVDEDEPSDSYFEVTPTLVGGNVAAPLNVNVVTS